MRSVLVLGVLILLVSAPGAWARPTQSVVLEETVSLSSGQAWRECREVPAGILVTVAQAASGRSGEIAYLGLAPDGQHARPDVQLDAPLGTERVLAAHRVEAGAYCWSIVMSERYPSPSGTHPYDVPVKISTIRVTHEPR